MNHLPSTRFAGLLLLILAASDGAAFAAEPGALRVGVAKVDMTPAELAGKCKALQVQYTGVHDKMYARAIVLGNDTTSAAPIEIDTGCGTLRRRRVSS